MKNKLLLKCDCGCNTKVELVLHPEKMLEISVKDSTKHEWHKWNGAVFYEDKMRKIKEFIKEIWYNKDHGKEEK